MALITQNMKTMVENNSIGFYATVVENGSPCVSPKGTSVVLDEETIAFANIRSPQTLANILNKPEMEVNFLDVLSRRALRAKGLARYVELGSEEFATLLPAFSKWENLMDRMKGIVVLKVNAAKEIKSPVYDIGADEAELRAHWKQHYQNL